MAYKNKDKCLSNCVGVCLCKKTEHPPEPFSFEKNLKKFMLRAKMNMFGPVLS